ncbi:MAG TPA: AsmA-like C-terminal region-containing protein [Chitinophagaceae bacterium]|nr:AsmA-like C-terminal region-containing protein [Chitinophagaceae bacterium]
MKKILRKTLKITGITLVILIALLFLIPVIFKKQIVALVKKEINKSLTATVDFRDVDLSLFRHFPKISIGLKNVSVVGTNEFANDTLLSARTFDASVDLFSAIKGKDVKIYGVYLESPRIHALVNKAGKANWDISKPATDTSTSSDSSPSEFRMNLRHYKISNGYIYYNDESGNMSAEIAGLDHEGSGDFTSDIFTLATKTKAEAFSFNYESIPYFLKTQTGIDADIQVDNSGNKYTFRTDDIRLNDLKLNAEGFFQLVNDSVYNMDIKFKTPSNEFKDILSLIPAVYKQDFDKIKTSGQATLNGFVKGTYSPQQMPAYDINLAVKDGVFQYPDLPEPVKNIQLDMRASNIDGKPDNTVVDISRGHLEMAKEPFDFKLLFKNPETSRYIDAIVKGRLDLANISKFIKLEGGTKLSGMVWADAYAKGNMSALEKQSGNFTAGGFLDIKDLSYSSSAFPQPVRNGNMKVQLANSGGIADNTSVDISSGHVEIGKDPLDFTLQLSKPMSAVEFAGTAKGQFTLDNIKQFTVLDPGTTVSGLLNADFSFKGNKTAIDKGEYDKIAINGNARLDKLKYVSRDYPSGINISTTELGFEQRSVSLKNLSGNYLNTNFTANGEFNNLVGYAMQDQPLTGSLNITADKMNLNDWMGTDTAAATGSSATATTSSAAEPFIVPAGIDLTINARAGDVKYDKVNYRNINGRLGLKNETVTLQDVKTEALDGTVAFNGSYSTLTNKKEPAINIGYDIKNVDIQKAFYSFVTMQKLMPIGQFLAGKISSQLSMTGNLHGDMMPDLSSLTGKGNLLLLEGVLKKFAPLEKIASTLQIDELKSISIKDVKNFIEFTNGRVLVKPFTVKVKDIEMQIGGMHGFDQSLDYSIQMKVPRKYLGNEGNNIVNNLASQATAKGIPVKLGDVVNLNIKMGGKLTDPTIKTELKEVAGDAIKDMQQQAVDFAKAKADTAKQRVTDSLTAVKNQVLNDLKNEAKDRLLGNKDSIKSNTPAETKSKAEQTLKNTLNNLLNKKKKPATDTTGKQ